MSDYNNNGRDDVHDIVDVLKKTTEVFSDSIRELNENNQQSNERDYASAYSEGQSRRVVKTSPKAAKTIRTIVFIWLGIQFVPVIFTLLFAALSNISGVVENVGKFVEEHIVSEGTELHIDMPGGEYHSNTGDTPSLPAETPAPETKENLFDKFPDLQLFDNDTNYALIAVAALVVGIILILIIRAVTTKEENTSINKTVENKTNENEFSNNNNQ